MEAKLKKLFSENACIQWTWDVDETQVQIQQQGYWPYEETEDDCTFVALNRDIKARVRADGQVVCGVEFVLSAYDNPHLLDETDYSQRQDEYEELFYRAVQTLEILLGPPLFVGASGEKGFPADQWADFAAVWTLNECRMMIQQKQNDKELPLELCLVFAPLTES